MKNLKYYLIPIICLFYFSCFYFFGIDQERRTQPEVKSQVFEQEIDSVLEVPCVQIPGNK
ncbi:MAG: hypothetical protein JXQ90_18385 [Cyclobacteriaceae bacterium]